MDKKKKKNDIIDFLLCLNSVSKKESPIKVLKTCLKVAKLCLSVNTLSSGLLCTKAAIGFFKRFVPKGVQGFKTQLLVKTSLVKFKALLISVCTKKNKNLKVLLKKLLRLVTTGSFKALMTYKTSSLLGESALVCCKHA